MKKEIKQFEIDYTLPDVLISDDSEEFLSTYFKRLLKTIPPGGQYSLTARCSIGRMNGSKVEAA